MITHSVFCDCASPAGLCFFEVLRKPSKRVFHKLFGKVEFIWWCVLKCDSSPAERALILALVGLHAVGNWALVAPCRLEVLHVLACWERCCARVCVRAGRTSWQKFRPSLYRTYFSQPLSFCDKTFLCSIYCSNDPACSFLLQLQYKQVYSQLTWVLSNDFTGSGEGLASATSTGLIKDSFMLTGASHFIA